MFAIDINSDSNEMRQAMQKSGHSKIPVYEKSLDNIKGMIFLYDVIKHKSKKNKNVSTPMHFLFLNKKNAVIY